MHLLRFLPTIFLIPSALGAPTSAPKNEPRMIEVDKRQGGFTWSFWQEGSGSHNCQNGAGGSYTAKWSGGGGFVCGKGWTPGGNRAVKYSGTYTPTGPGYLSLYGWTRNPLVEYYIVESYDVLAPGEPWTKKGNVTIDGEGTYDIYTSQRVNKPSIVGTATFTQYWSVRTEKRVGGTITTGKHFDAWNKLGMKLGQQDYMILATEGFANGAKTASGNSALSLG